QKAACVGFKRPTATTSPGAPVSVFFGISVLYRLDWGFGRRSWALYSDYQSKFPPECLRFPCNPWLTEARELCTSAVDCLHRLMGAHTPPFTYRQRQTCWQNSGTHTHTHTHTYNRIFSDPFWALFTFGKKTKMNRISAQCDCHLNIQIRY